MEEGKVYVGVDVAKEHLDVCWTGCSAPSRVRNDDEGIAELVKVLCERSPALVVMEATGGYPRRLLVALLEAKLPAVAIHPRQARDAREGARPLREDRQRRRARPHALRRAGAARGASALG